MNEVYELGKDALYEMINKEKVENAGMEFIPERITSSKIGRNFLKQDENLWYYNPSGPWYTLDFIKYVIIFCGR